VIYYGVIKHIRSTGPGGPKTKAAKMGMGVMTIFMPEKEWIIPLSDEK
jgi:hypothetical protein